MSSALEEVLEQLLSVLRLLSDACQGLTHASTSVEESTQLLTLAWHGARDPDAEQALAALTEAQGAVNQTYELVARSASITQAYLLSLGGDGAAKPASDATVPEYPRRAVTVGSWRGKTAAEHALDQGRAIGRPPERPKRRPIREVRSLEELNRLFETLSVGGAVLDELRASAAEAAEDDWVYFAELVGMVREITGSADDLLGRTGRAAAQLVRDGSLVPGTLTEADGFTAWDTGPAESADRIEREVASMVRAGVRPQPGDVCWFDLPDGE